MKLSAEFLSKEAGFGANAALQKSPNIHELEEAMYNFASVATRSKNILGQLVENNTKLTTQLADVMK
eukprot:12173698-Ditylum_brightwellii.AAC.1